MDWITRPITESDVEIIAKTTISRGFVGMEQIHQVADAFEKDGKLMAIGGLIFLTPCTAWIWTEITQDGIDNIVSTYRVIKEWTDLAMEKYNLKRLQAYSRCEFSESQRMLKHLGFTIESTMKDFTPEGDAFMMVRIGGAA